MKEVFKEIIGYEGLYEISNYGNVKSVDRKRGSYVFGDIYLRNIKNSMGYCQVSLHKNGTRKAALVHRLVAINFIPNPEGKKSINHIDANRQNNIISNLEWCTAKENTQHGIKLGKITPRGEDNKNSKLKTEDVLFIRSCITSSKELGIKYGVDPMHINLIRRNKVWKHLL